MWLFRLPLVPKHAIPRRQKLRRDFLGRRLAGAAGDRHDPGAAIGGARRARDPAARASCRPTSMSSGAGIAVPASATPAPRATSAPTAPAAQRVGDELRARRTDRRGSRRRSRRPAASASRSRRGRSPVAGSPCTSRPPVARSDVSGAQRQPLHAVNDTRRAGAAPRQRGPRHLHVVERQHPFADDLVFLVALAGDQHQVAAAGLADGPLDRLLAIDDRETAASLALAAAAARAAIGGRRRCRA